MSFLSVNLYSTASNVSFVNAISISLVCVPCGLLWCYKAVSLHFTKTMLWFFIPDDFFIERKVLVLDFILYAQAVSSDGDCFFIMNDSPCAKKLETGRRHEHSVLLLLLYQGQGQGQGQWLLLLLLLLLWLLPLLLQSLYLDGLGIQEISIVRIEITDLMSIASGFDGVDDLNLIISYFQM